MNKVLVGMSGGVDSSVAAAILKDKGYSVAGVSLKMYEGDSSCSGESDREDARKVCETLDIPHYIYDMTQEFKKHVIDKFSTEYMEGRTPNPCVDCNSNIKFSGLLKAADELGYDYIATGHYAGLEYKNDKIYLTKSEDLAKDQSYFLYNLTPDILKRILFPIDGMDKEEVREVAKKHGLPVYNKPDSQDICFVPDGDYNSYLKDNLNISSKEGQFVDTKGTVLGTHTGHMNYTIGQRRGLGIAIGKPAYVVDILPQSNRVVIGDNDDLFSNEMIIRDTNFITGDKITQDTKVAVKTRYSQKETPAIVTPLGNNRYKVVFDTPVRAITPGQAGVLYDGKYLLGGGTIE